MNSVFNKFSIRSFIIIFIIICILLPSLSATIFLHSYVVNTITSTYTNNYVDAIFNGIEGEVNSVIAQINNISFELIGNQELTSLLNDKGINHSTKSIYVNRVLGDCITRYKSITAIELRTESNDSYLYGFNEDYKSQINAEFLGSLSNQKIKFNSSIVKVDNKYYCMLGKKIYNYTNSRNICDIIVYVNESAFQPTASDTGVFYLSIGNKVVAHPDKKYIGYAIYTPNDYSTKSKYNLEGYSLINHNITNVSADNDDIIITGIINNSILHSTMKNIISIIYVIFLFSIIITILVAIIFSKKLIKRVTNLNKNLEVFSIDSKHDILISPKSEIVSLEESFNKMSKEIQTLIKRIETESNNRRIAEISMLQSQINPHFIYNALDTVSWVAKRNKQYEIDDMLFNIATFFRIGLHKGENTISISDEIKHVNSYVNIEKKRFPDSFDVTFDIDEDILSYKIIKIVLQPIVENSINHGFKNIEHKGIVKIKAIKDGNYIRFTVSDNGTGINHQEDLPFPKSQKPLGGYGLFNVNERLIRQYGSECGIKFKSNENVGTTVSFSIKIGRVNFWTC